MNTTAPITRPVPLLGTTSPCTTSAASYTGDATTTVRPCRARGRSTRLTPRARYPIAADFELSVRSSEQTRAALDLDLAAA
jgi:hypothetical protein